MVQTINRIGGSLELWLRSVLRHLGENSDRLSFNVSSTHGDTE